MCCYCENGAVPADCQVLLDLSTSRRAPAGFEAQNPEVKGLPVEQHPKEVCSRSGTIRDGGQDRNCVL